MNETQIPGLTEVQQRVLDWYLAGLKPRTMAAFMGCSTQRVYVILNRLRELEVIE